MFLRLDADEMACLKTHGILELHRGQQLAGVIYTGAGSVVSR